MYNLYYYVLIFIELYSAILDDPLQLYSAILDHPLQLYLVILGHPLVSRWWYQMLYNTIWPPDDGHNSARNM